PKSTSATALPPDCPGYQACKIASQLATSGSNPIGDPEQLTKTTFFPASFSAFIKLRCTAGSSISVRSPPLKPGRLTPISSPSREGDIPPTKTTTSASCTFSTVLATSISSLYPTSYISWASPRL